MQGTLVREGMQFLIRAGILTRMQTSEGHSFTQTSTSITAGHREEVLYLAIPKHMAAHTFTSSSSTPADTLFRPWS